MDKTPIGYKALCEEFQLSVIPHYRESYVAKNGRGKTIIDNKHEIHIYPKSYSLSNPTDLFAHLEFALKHDGLNLEIIKAFFLKTEKIKVLQYVQAQPTSAYSRKIWFLYECLMGEKLDMPDCQKLKYVDLLDAKKYFVGQIIKSPRHAINDNLLGNMHFCPIIRRTDILKHWIETHLDTEASSLLSKYDPHLIARACHYLYTKETMSSYQIESEQPDKSRITRFINMLQQAHTIDVLTKKKLIELQNVIVDERFRDADYRGNQNYVAENISLTYQKIHYISPKPGDVPELMRGFLDALNRMLNANVHPVIIAAAAAFGFVFIHPFEDGNGRLHRFLIHQVLSRKNFTPKNIIFPVSSIMLQNMHEYDAILESFSKPLLAILTDYELSDEGVMVVNQDSKSFYQYIDYTNMADYLFVCIKEAIHNYIEREIIFLANYDKTKIAMQDIVDMPDSQIDLFIKCVLQNKGNLSSQKRKRLFLKLTDDEVNRLVLMVRENMLVDSSVVLEQSRGLMPR